MSDHIVGSSDIRDGVGWAHSRDEEYAVIRLRDLLDRDFSPRQAVHSTLYARDYYLDNVHPGERISGSIIRAVTPAEIIAPVEVLEPRSPRRGTPPRPCAVYRLFNEAEELLYVGKSVNPKWRFRQHTRRAWCPDVDEGRIVAIRDENPLYNRVGGDR